jgi:hypothetical protein
MEPFFIQTLMQANIRFITSGESAWMEDSERQNWHHISFTLQTVVNGTLRGIFKQRWKSQHGVGWSSGLTCNPFSPPKPHTPPPPPPTIPGNADFYFCSIQGVSLLIMFFSPPSRNFSCQRIPGHIQGGFEKHPEETICHWPHRDMGHHIARPVN